METIKMKIKNLFLKEFENVAESIDAFPWNDKLKYANYLAQTYFYTMHSTRLLAVGAGRFGVEDEQLHQRFLKHGIEEKGHHTLALNDLAKLGYKITDFTEMPVTSILYQPQYYYMHHKDPASLFGYILTLEGGSWLKAKSMFEKAASFHGADKAVFLKVHAEHDPEHIDTAFEHISKFSDDRLDLIVKNMKQSNFALKTFFKTLAHSDLSEVKGVHHSNSQQKKAA
jgi:hypothetical protein